MPFFISLENVLVKIGDLKWDLFGMKYWIAILSAWKFKFYLNIEIWIKGEFLYKGSEQSIKMPILSKIINNINARQIALWWVKLVIKWHLFAKVEAADTG